VSCFIQEAGERKLVPKEHAREIESTHTFGESQGLNSGFLTSALSNIFGLASMVSYSDSEQETGQTQ